MSKYQIAVGPHHRSDVDEDVYAAISESRWHAARRSGLVYAARSVVQNGRRRSVYLHREIVNAQAGDVVDHINRNTLDNRRANLRIVGRSQNLINSGVSKRNSSGFKGVHLDRVSNCWVAKVYAGGKSHHAGKFACKIRAAYSRDALAVALQGPLTHINISDRPIECDRGLHRSCPSCERLAKAAEDDDGADVPAFVRKTHDHIAVGEQA